MFCNTAKRSIYTQTVCSIARQHLHLVPFFFFSFSFLKLFLVYLPKWNKNVHFYAGLTNAVSVVYESLQLTNGSRSPNMYWSSLALSCIIRLQKQLKAIYCKHFLLEKPWSTLKCQSGMFVEMGGLVEHFWVLVNHSDPWVAVYAMWIFFKLWEQWEHFLCVSSVGAHMVTNTQWITARSIKVAGQFYGLKPEAAAKGTAVVLGSQHFTVLNWKRKESWGARGRGQIVLSSVVGELKGLGVTHNSQTINCSQLGYELKYH